MKDDTVSRAAAIDAVRNFGDCENGYSDTYDKAFIISALEALPAVQPQPEIVRCKDCKHADDDGVCQNSVGLVIQDDDDFCSRAVRRTDGV